MRRMGIFLSTGSVVGGGLHGADRWGRVPVVNSETMAHRLGTTPHLSPLLMKARRLGLAVPEDLERLAVQRGLRYYGGPGDSDAFRDHKVDYGAGKAGNPAKHFSNEELALALLSPALVYSQHRVRLGAAMLSAKGNSPEKLARLARMERCERAVHYIAKCGQRVEPGNRFWSDLLDHFPSVIEVDAYILPHITRFVAMTGITRRGVETLMQWIRPSAVATP
jgi:hypothetical protein